MGIVKVLKWRRKGTAPKQCRPLLTIEVGLDGFWRTAGGERVKPLTVRGRYDLIEAVRP